MSEVNGGGRNIWVHYTLVDKMTAFRGDEWMATDGETGRGKRYVKASCMIYGRKVVNGKMLKFLH